jgi:homoserine O-acetyltransferase
MFKSIPTALLICAIAQNGAAAEPATEIAPQNAKNTAAPIPNETDGTYVAHNFRFSDGTVLPEVKLHYVTLGKPLRNSRNQVTNAVLLLHGTTGSSKQFLTDVARSELFAANQPLDVRRYFVIVPDGLGRGGSSKPSDGMRMKFPHYGYNDVVEAQHLLVTEGLHVDHLRLVLGTSMGGMQTWLWGERYPDMADGLMPIASQPIAMAGRNWFWRQMIIGAIENDPAWYGGNYETQPTQWIRTMPVFALMTGNAPRMQSTAPDRTAAAHLYDSLVASYSSFDANDVLYWFRSSWDYDPQAQLSRIKA